MCNIGERCRRVKRILGYWWQESNPSAKAADVGLPRRSVRDIYASVTLVPALEMLPNRPDDQDVQHYQAQEDESEHPYLPARSVSSRIPNQSAVALTTKTATP